MIHRGVSVARRNFLAQQRGPAEKNDVRASSGSEYLCTVYFGAEFSAGSLAFHLRRR